MIRITNLLMALLFILIHNNSANAQFDGECTQPTVVSNCRVSIACIVAERFNWDMGGPGCVISERGGISYCYSSPGTYRITRDGSFFGTVTVASSNCSCSNDCIRGDDSPDTADPCARLGFTDDNWPTNQFTLFNPTADDFFITSNYRNPIRAFNSETVRVTVTDFLGRRVGPEWTFNNPRNRIQIPGTNFIGNPLTAGVYRLRVTFENCFGRKTRNFTVVLVN